MAVAKGSLGEVGWTATHLLQPDDVAVTSLHPLGEPPLQGGSDPVDVEAGDAHMQECVTTRSTEAVVPGDLVQPVTSLVVGGTSAA